MDAQWITVALAALAFLGQGVNIVLHLSIKSAILESEARTKEWVSAHYVSRHELLASRGLGQ